MVVEMKFPVTGNKWGRGNMNIDLHGESEDAEFTAQLLAALLDLGKLPQFEDEVEERGLAWHAICRKNRWTICLGVSMKRCIAQKTAGVIKCWQPEFRVKKCALTRALFNDGRCLVNAQPPGKIDLFFQLAMRERQQIREFQPE